MRKGSLRKASQALFLIVSVIGVFGIAMTGIIYPYFFCVACPGAVGNCPLGAAQHSVLGITTDSWLKMGLYVFGFVGVVAMIFGRAFCGWACPMGTLQDLISPFTRRINKKIKPPSIKWARYVKYGLLGILLVMPYFTKVKWFCLYCPGGMVTATIPTLGVSLYNGDQWVAGDYLTMKIVFTVIFLLLVLLFTRGWCRYLCPYGAWTAPFNKISFLRLYRDDDACIHCNKCTRACPMDIDVVKENRSPECILCGRCEDVCPVNCLDLRFKGGKGPKNATQDDGPSSENDTPQPADQ